MPTPHIAAGGLRHLVLIQQRSTSHDAAGGQVETWTTIRSPWAKIMLAGTPKEQFQAGGFSAQVGYTISTRWLASPIVLPGMRVLFGTHVYLIQAVVNVDQRNILMELTCLEIDGGQ